jgi:hypothetical protein
VVFFLILSLSYFVNKDFHHFNYILSPRRPGINAMTVHVRFLVIQSCTRTDFSVNTLVFPYRFHFIILLCSCILLSWYAVYFMANMHCVLLIDLIYVFSYGLRCITYMMNNMYTLQHVRMTVSRTVTLLKYDLWLRVMLRHRHVLHKVLARRILDSD